MLFGKSHPTCVESVRLLRILFRNYILDSVRALMGHILVLFEDALLTLVSL